MSGKRPHCNDDECCMPDEEEGGRNSRSSMRMDSSFSFPSAKKISRSINNNNSINETMNGSDNKKEVAVVREPVVNKDDDDDDDDDDDLPFCKIVLRRTKTTYNGHPTTAAAAATVQPEDTAGSQCTAATLPSSHVAPANNNHNNSNNNNNNHNTTHSNNTNNHAPSSFVAVACNRAFAQDICPFVKLGPGRRLDFLRHIVASESDRARLVQVMDEAIRANSTNNSNANNNNQCSTNTNETLLLPKSDAATAAHSATTRRNLTTANNNNNAKNSAGVATTTTGPQPMREASSSSSTASSSSLLIFRATNIAIMTLAECHAGLPIRRTLDWTVGNHATANRIVLYGTISNNNDNNSNVPLKKSNFEETQFQDAQMMGFFQSAPIALHRLSAEGIVLWANPAGCTVLGTTPHDHVGQDIFQYCWSPDDADVIRRVLDTLAQGQTVTNVPVRLCAPGSRQPVDLLMETHLPQQAHHQHQHQYSYGTTNDTTTATANTTTTALALCFLHADTQSQIRQAQTSLLQEETKRSLQMLDNFMSRSLHHMRSPLHVLQTSMDIVKQHLGDMAIRVVDQPEMQELVQDCDFLLVRARSHVTKAVDMIDDISDLARLDQGLPLRLSNDLIQLKDLGTDVFAHAADVPSHVQVALELSGGHGPPFIHSDVRYLKKILCNLVEHLASSSHSMESSNTESDTSNQSQQILRTITLKIGHNSNSCIFTVTEAAARPVSGSSVASLMAASSSTSLLATTSLLEDSSGMGSNSSFGGLPPIFQRYRQPNERSQRRDDTDWERVSDRRDTFVTGINSLCHNSMGMGLSLAYHLVRTLGGVLRHSSQSVQSTKFWFSVPHNNGGVLSCERIVFDRPKVRYTGHFLNSNNNRSSDELSLAYRKAAASAPVACTPCNPSSEIVTPAAAVSSIPSLVQTTPISDGTTTPVAPPAKTNFPSVLVVEDVPICAKLLCTILRQFKCSATWVKNGQEAVDILTKDEEAADRFHLIFMDLRMPVMDGLTATKIIKQQLNMPTPVVALTGEGGDQIRDECMKIGFDAYCKKPMTREELMKVVQEHTGYVYQ